MCGSCGYNNLGILRCGSVKRSSYGAVYAILKYIYIMSLCCSVFPVFRGAVTCGSQRSGINRTVGFGAVINPTVRFGAISVFATVRGQFPQGSPYKFLFYLRLTA